uniref:Thy-1 membrane glycoprotein n=1 Tax=Varanus komodoensis TaxID=61221 RepID=A0A8D2IV83_VARKO
SAPLVGLAAQLHMLQVARCQRVRDLTACLSGKSLRLDCHYDRKTDNPLSYEFRLTKDHGEGSVVAGNLKVPSSVYKGRASVNTTNNLVCLYLHGFTTADEGVYVCKLKITNDYEGPDSRNISVIKDRLEKCAGISLLIQNTSWLLLLLLSLPLLQAPFPCPPSLPPSLPPSHPPLKCQDHGGCFPGCQESYPVPSSTWVAGTVSREGTELQDIQCAFFPLCSFSYQTPKSHWEKSIDVNRGKFSPAWIKGVFYQ